MTDRTHSKNMRKRLDDTIDTMPDQNTHMREIGAMMLVSRFLLETVQVLEEIRDRLPEKENKNDD